MSLSKRDSTIIMEYVILLILSGSLLFLSKLDEKCFRPPLSTRANNKNVKCYTSLELHRIRSMMNKSPHLKVLSPTLINNIRSFKIHRRRKRGRRGGVANEAILLDNRIKTVAPTHSQSQIQQSNDGHVQGISRHQLNWKNNLHLMLINIRSIKKNDISLYDYISANHIDLCFISETWLSTSDTDLAWGIFIII